jgi:hypothetical protein
VRVGGAFGQGRFVRAERREPGAPGWHRRPGRTPLAEQRTARSWHRRPSIQRVRRAGAQLRRRMSLHRAHAAVRRAPPCTQCSRPDPTSVGPQYGRSTVKRSRTSAARATPRTVSPYPASRAQQADDDGDRGSPARQRSGRARCGQGACLALFGSTEPSLAPAPPSPIVEHPILIPVVPRLLTDRHCRRPRFDGVVDMMRSGRRGEPSRSR